MLSKKAEYIATQWVTDIFNLLQYTIGKHKGPNQTGKKIYTYSGENTN